MNIVNDRRPLCDICGKARADYTITVSPIISQFAGDNASEVYMCARHYRMMLNTIDKMLTNKKGRAQ